MTRGETFLIDQAGVGGPVGILARHAIDAIGLELGQVAAAQDKHVGMRLGDYDPACPERWVDKRLISLDDLDRNGSAETIFSSLRTEEGAAYEPLFAKDRLVTSNSPANRGMPGVPVVDAFINAGSIDEMYDRQGGTGRLTGIMCGGNCMSVILATASQPLYQEVGIRSMRVETMQGWSGKGLSEVPKDEGEFPPITGDEQDKIKAETNMFLGESMNEPADIFIVADPKRGPWVRGHRARVEAKMARETSKREMEHIWRHFKAPKIFESVRREIRGLSKVEGQDWPRRYKPISPVKVEYGDLIRYDTKPISLTRIHPLRVNAHVQSIEIGDPNNVTFEVAGDNLMIGAVAVNFLNYMYARAMGYLG